jgi:hypothetical protein
MEKWVECRVSPSMLELVVTSAAAQSSNSTCAGVLMMCSARYAVSASFAVVQTGGGTHVRYTIGSVRLAGSLGHFQPVTLARYGIATSLLERDSK